jgi:hypothetical protein
MYMYDLLGAASQTYLLGQPHLSLVPGPVLAHLSLLGLVPLHQNGALQGPFSGMTKDRFKLTKDCLQD